MDRLWNRIESARLYKKLSESRRLGRLVNRETILYLFFGVLTTAVSVGSFKLFGLLFSALDWDGALGLLRHRTGYAYIDANVLSWVCAVLFAFVTNKLYVFGSKTRERAAVLRELSGFFGARLTTLLIDTGLMFLLVSVLRVDEMTAKLLVQVVVLVLNYIFSKLFVFKKSGNTSKE